VNPVPAVTVSANHAAAGPGAVLTFSAHVTGGTGSFHYVWDFGDQTAGTGATVTHSYAKAGEHRASVIVTDAVGGTGEGSTTVMVSAFAITTEASATQAVTGDMISFTASATDAAGGPYTYVWDFGDGKIDTGATVTHSYANAGTFTARVTVTDASGFSQEKALSPITVEARAPSASVSPNVPVSIAGGLAVIVIVTVLAWAALRRKRP
jgi:PKD repeat protein